MTPLTRFGGKYVIERVLGQGAFGVVYVARDEMLERHVAVKTVKSTLGGTGGDFERRFLREARIAARLNHVNIATIFEAGQEGETIYLVMELVDGQPLRRIMDERGRFDPLECLPVMEQILDALEHAHSQGVVHRDIKPENILVRSDGILKVTDFGIAKLLASQTSTLTQDGAVVGTPSYMAPEQVMSKPATPRADLYSSCAVLYEMLAGARPFTGETLPALLYKVLTAAPPELPDVVPPPVRAVVARGMAKAPEQRFGSARELLDALRDALDVPARVGPPVPGSGGIGPDEAPTATSGISTAARAVWVAPEPGVPPARRGGIEEKPLVELLLELQRDRVEGLLVVEASDWAMGLELADGMLHAVHGGPPELWTGALLRDVELVDEQGWGRIAAEMARAGLPPSRSGEAAVRLGLVTPADLLKILEVQRSSRIKLLLTLERGVFRFHQGYHAEADWQSLPPLPIGGLVRDAIRSRPEVGARVLARFRARVQGKGLRAGPAAIELLPRFRLGPRTQRLLGLLDGRTLGDAVAAATDPEAELSAYLLWAAGGIDLVAVTPTPRPMPAAAPPEGARPLPADRPSVKVERLPTVRPPEGGRPLPADRPSVKVERLPTVRPPEGPRAIPQDRPSARVERLPSVAPGGAGASPRAVSDALARARELLQGQRYEEARRLLLETRALAPKEPQVLAGLGWATFRAQPGSVEAKREARRLLEEAVAGDPRMADACVRLAHVLRLDGELIQARHWLERALQADPENADAALDLRRLDELSRRKS